MNDTHSIQTSLKDNPFCILGATTRDDRRRIVELANERQLELEPKTLQHARSELTNPRRRMRAELGWLPGVAPTTASQLVEQCLQRSATLDLSRSLPALAKANLTSTVLQEVDASDPKKVAESILEFALIVEEVSADEALRDINEDRAVSGFPQIQELGQIEEGLAERKRDYRSTVMGLLDRLRSSTLVDVVTFIAHRSTRAGECHAPELVDELIDTYRVEAQDFLQKEAKNIDELIASARRTAAAGEDAVTPTLKRLTEVTRNWDQVAQPIQISFKARGQHHPASNEVAYAIRSLAVDLHNDFGMLEPARRLADMLKDVFAEVPVVAETVEEDAEALDSNLKARKQEESERRKWAQEITYSAEIGALFKKTLRISPNGVSWGNQHYPLETITRVRWGGVRHSVNFIPTGTTYTIAFGDSTSEAVVETRREEVFRTFIEKLHHAVGTRLVVELLRKVRDGQVGFGEIQVRDTGVTLPKRSFLSRESVDCTWSEVQVWSAEGSFYIGATDDKKTRAGLSYIHTPNTHILEQAIRAAFRKGAARLSDLLHVR